MSIFYAQTAEMLSNSLKGIKSNCNEFQQILLLYHQLATNDPSLIMVKERETHDQTHENGRT